MKIEICRVGDKNASHLVEVNTAAGYKVYCGTLYDRGEQFYYIDILNHRPITAEFKSITDGWYDFVKVENGMKLVFNN